MKVDNQFHITRVFSLADKQSVGSCLRDEHITHTLTQGEEADRNLFGKKNAAVYL